MQFSIREARQRFSHLLKAVEQGEEVEITRRGRVVARLTRPKNGPEQAGATSQAGKRQALRNSLPPAQTSSADLLREIRDERG